MEIDNYTVEEMRMPVMKRWYKVKRDLWHQQRKLDFDYGLEIEGISRNTPFAAAKAPKHATHNLFIRLPREVRDIIYDLALPPHHDVKNPALTNTADPSKLYLRHPKTPFATEPPLLRVSKLIREEAGELFYSSRAFILRIASADPASDELAFTLKLLENILAQHGQEAFQHGGLEIVFPTTKPGKVLKRVTDFVRGTGMVLGGHRVVGIRDRLIPSVVGVGQAVSDYMVYQAILHDGRRDVWPAFLLAWGLVAHSRGWDAGLLAREWRWLRDVVRDAVLRAETRRGWRRQTILLAVEGEASVVLDVMGKKVEVVRTVRVVG